MNTRRSLRGVQGEGCRGVNQFDLHANVGHVADVDATAVAHGADRQRQGTSHRRGFNRCELAVSLPAEQSVFGDCPNVVGAQGSGDEVSRPKGGCESVRRCARFAEQQVVS